jgi:hypothetical protein
LEGVGLFMSLLFRRYDLRKVCFAVTSSTFESLGNIGMAARIDGRLRDRYYDPDGFEDQILLSIEREQWQEDSLGALFAAPPVTNFFPRGTVSVDAMVTLLQSICGVSVDRAIRLCDIPLDSLSFVEWVVAMEDALDCRLSDDAVQGIDTRMTVYQAIEALTTSI